MLIGCCPSVQLSGEHRFPWAGSRARDPNILLDGMDHWMPHRAMPQQHRQLSAPTKFHFCCVLPARESGLAVKSLFPLTAASPQRSGQTNSELAAICRSAWRVRVLPWSLLWYWKQQLSGHAAAMATQGARATAARPPGTTNTIWHTPWEPSNHILGVL